MLSAGAMSWEERQVQRMSTKEYTGADLGTLVSELNVELNQMSLPELIEFRRAWRRELVRVNANAAVMRMCLDLVERVIRSKSKR